MRNVKLLNGLFLCVLAGSVFISCSNSSSPGPSYSLNLTLVSHTQQPIFDTLQFQVTKGGNNLANADLISIMNGTYYVMTDLKIKSDSTGKFPPLPITKSDSFPQIAYQAVYDTFTSNYVYWQWP